MVNSAITPSQVTNPIQLATPATSSSSVTSTSATTPLAVVPTIDQIQQVCTGSPRRNLEQYAPYILKAMASAGLVSKNQLIAVMATIYVETGAFAPVRERLGQAACNRNYGGRLGNNRSNDGYLFRGGGFIQLTGRGNYTAATRDLNIDLINDPDLTIDPEQSARIFIWFWKGGNGSNNPSRPAEQGDWAGARRAVNGGLNGYDVYRPAIDRGLRVFTQGIDPNAVGQLPMPSNYGLNCVDTGTAGSRTVAGGTIAVSSQADALTQALGLHMLDRQKAIAFHALLNPAEHSDLLKLAPQKTFEGKNFGEGLDGTLTVEEIKFYCGGSLEMEVWAHQPDPNAPPPLAFLHDTSLPLNQNTGVNETITGGSVTPTADGEFLNPCIGSPCLSRMGWRQSTRSNHRGIDLAGSNRTIVCAAEGIVTNVVTGCREGDNSCGGGYGNRVFVRHNINGQTHETRYAHLSSVSEGIAVGAQVTKSQTLGVMGNTGHSRGVHLHFEIRDGAGACIDPFVTIKPTPSVIRNGGPAVPFR